MDWLDSLEHSVFPQDWNFQLEDNFLPHNGNLKHLELGYRFNTPLNGHAFPLGLVTLTFGGYFNQSLDGGKFGTALTTLIFGRDFNQDMSQWRGLPTSLRHVKFCNERGQARCNLLKTSLYSNQCCSGVEVHITGHCIEGEKDGMHLELFKEWEQSR